VLICRAAVCLVSLLGGAMVWPLAARAQLGERMRRSYRNSQTPRGFGRVGVGCARCIWKCRDAGIDEGDKHARIWTRINRLRKRKAKSETTAERIAPMTIAVRHQLAVLRRQRPGPPQLSSLDRLLWVWLYRIWPQIIDAMVLVKPATVAQWHRKGVRFYWRWRSRRPGRPNIGTEVRALIRRMSKDNPLWGAPRIHGELLKLGIKISQATVGRWMPWRPKVPSPTWRSFLRNHLTDLAVIDMFVIATATFRLLYTLIVLNLDRRRVVHFEVTPNPTQDWLSGQMTEAFPWETSPRYLLRDRDKSYGPAFRHRVRAMGITEVITAPRSPWQNPYVERLIGSIRRECLDHVIILSERHLRRVLSSYFQYHHDARTHLSLDKDCPRPRAVQLPFEGNRIIALPQIGGLHHRYER
jgi:integrase-like protein